MKKEEYRNIYELELKHWWYQCIDHLVFQTIKKYHIPPKSVILDAGCGTGRVLHKLLRFNAFGIDNSFAAFKYWRRRGLTKMSIGDLMAMPYKSSQFDLIISTDVLYHNSITDDQIALNEFCRVLKPGGTLILNLAAFEILHGKHDEHVDTRERYRKKKIIDRVKKAGFTPLFFSYRLIFLFPFILIVRLAQRVFSRKDVQSSSDIFALPGWLNKVLFRIAKLENQLLQTVPLHLGTSLFLVAQRID